jgi:hypothetical protein
MQQRNETVVLNIETFPSNSINNIEYIDIICIMYLAIDWIKYLCGI